MGAQAEKITAYIQGRNSGSAELGVPIKLNPRVVPRPADLVGVFPVVRFRRQIDEENLVWGNGLEAVKHARGDLQEDAVVFPDDDGVGFSLGGAAGAVIKKTYFGHAVNHRDAVRLFLVGVPSLHNPGIDGAEVGLPESREVGVVLAEDFHHAPAVVTMLDQGDQFYSVDHGGIMEGRSGVERTR